MPDPAGPDLDRALRHQPGTGAARRGRGRQDRPARLRLRPGDRIPHGHGRRRRIRHGTGVRGTAATVRAADGTPRRDPRAAAAGAHRRVRPRRGGDSGPVPGRARGAEPAGGGRRGPAGALRGRRRAVARPGVGADARLHRATAAGRTRRPGLRRARPARGAGRPARTRRRRPVRHRRAGAVGNGHGRGDRPAGAGPHRRRDPRCTAGDPGGAAQRVGDRTVRRVLDLREAVIGGRGRARVRPSHPGVAADHPAAAAHRRGRTGRRRRAVPARRSGTRRPRGRPRPRRGGRAHRVRPANAVPPPP